MSTLEITMRPLERDDLRFVHDVNNTRWIMAYWFEEPYESFVELEELYQKHIHDPTERRFIVQDTEGTRIGLVELVEIEAIHRVAEFQIIISPQYQGHGYGRRACMMALEYGFCVLNLHKIYLIVAPDNAGAIKIYSDCGFIEEGTLVQEFFIEGEYRDGLRMYQLQPDYLARKKAAAEAFVAAEVIEDHSQF